MADRPSYFTSTTSQVLLLCVLGYLAVCLWMGWKGQLTESLAGVRWLLETALVLYGYRKGVEAATNGKAPTIGGPS